MTDMNKFVLVPIEEIKRPKEGYRCMVNRFWEVKDDCVLLYEGKYPQCNHDESIVRSLAEKYGNGVTKIEVAYVREY